MVEIPEQESDFLNGKLAYKISLRFLTITGEGQIVDTKDFNQNPVKRIELPVEFVDEKNINIKKKWQPNKKAEEILKKLFGKDSKGFVNKKIKIVLEAYKDSYIIKIDELETKALNPTAG